MMPSRRRLLRAALLSPIAPLVHTLPRTSPAEPVKPPRLRPGDTVGVFSPATASFEPVELDIVRETLAALGLAMKLGQHVQDRRGYLAGSDADRATDVNRLFADPEVHALMALRGGWGCSRILPLLDYDLIRRNPKILVGYSDVTALLLAVYARSGLVTFHGPVGVSTWNPFTVDYFRRVLFEGEAVRMANPRDKGELLAQTEDRVQTITPGTARGRLAGGNLTVLAALMGTPYLPAWDGHVLFLEDIGEDIYRIDRMLTQLGLGGVLAQLRGFVFGKCTRCEPGEGYGSLTLGEVFSDHVAPLGIPAWHGAMIGHIDDKFTVPLGVSAEIDAAAGTVQLLEPAVA